MTRELPRQAALIAVSGTTPAKIIAQPVAEQIEQQLPAPRSGARALKPLPSWGDASSLDGSQSHESLLYAMEGHRRRTARRRSRPRWTTPMPEHC